jgi:putative tricarboxylic transport membrane protein
MALFLSVLLVNNISPGPTFLKNNGNLFWVLIASMLIGNLILVFVNIFAVPVFLRITKIKQKIINFVVIAACTIGVYYINYNFFDVIVMYFFGVIGYFLKRCSFDFTTLLLGLLLGPRLEEYFIQLMKINHGDPFSLFNSKIAIFFYIFSLIVLFYCRGDKKNV